MNHLFPMLGMLMLVACVESTGGDMVTFHASAAGPVDATSPLPFLADNGYQITLTRARLHIGAIYLNESAPISVAQETSCTLPGLYVAEVTASLDVDLLSVSPMRFPELGRGNTHHAVVGEVWLSGGDVNASNDTTVILDIAGTASKDGADYPFDGIVTIGSNRAIPVKDPALPGSNPICKQRIVSPIPTDITLADGGELLLRIDPRAFFDNVDFSSLERVQESPPLYRFADRTDGQPNVNLYKGLRSRLGVYTFSWRDIGE
jgi:hypothetical protein